MRLPDIRRERGDAGARTAIAEALEKHHTIRAAAEALGVLPHVFRRTAKSVGLTLPHEPRGIPKGSPGYERRWGARPENAAAAPPPEPTADALIPAPKPSEYGGWRTGAAKKAATKPRKAK